MAVRLARMVQVPAPTMVTESTLIVQTLSVVELKLTLVSSVLVVVALTVNGAYEFYAEVSKGALESGKPADFVVLDKSPVKSKPMTRKHIRVVETIKDGKRVYQATP